jgi:DNA-binding NarL/FixJ family response regulator
MRGNGANGASSPGVLVIDPTGEVFAVLRAANVGTGLWRVTNSAKVADLAGFGLAVFAEYERPNWSTIAKISERVPTVVVVTHADAGDAYRAITFGAFGYVDATLAPDAMRRTLQGALRGEPAYPRRILAEFVKNQVRSLQPGKALSLTPRQREVIALIATGAADKEIARALGITTATAQKHVTNLLKRLNVPNRAAAVAVTGSYSAFL